jgi:hypothetical protein
MTPVLTGRKWQVLKRRKGFIATKPGINPAHGLLDPAHKNIESVLLTPAGGTVMKFAGRQPT